MKTDLVARIDKDNAAHTLMIGVFLDDGFLKEVRVKEFDAPLKARNLQKEAADWFDWPIGTPDERATYERIRSKRDAPTP